MGIFSSAVPPGSGAFQMPTRLSSAAAALRGGGGGGGGGEEGQSQRFSNFFSILAWSFFGMTFNNIS